MLTKNRLLSKKSNHWYEFICGSHAFLVQEIKFCSLDFQVFNDFYGDSLQSTQNLIKKHQLLEQDLIQHESQFESVSNSAAQMIGHKHFASDQIRSRLQALEKEMQILKNQTFARRSKLKYVLSFRFIFFFKFNLNHTYNICVF